MISDCVGVSDQIIAQIITIFFFYSPQNPDLQ